jgi:hypothetical protein
VLNDVGEVMSRLPRAMGVLVTGRCLDGGLIWSDNLGRLDPDPGSALGSSITMDMILFPDLESNDGVRQQR